VDIAAMRTRPITTEKTTRAIGLDMVSTPCQHI
jgi:hypothetical protein